MSRPSTLAFPPGRPARSRTDWVIGLTQGERWTAEDRDRGAPYFGWLCTELPTYPETLHLKTQVHDRKPGVVPFVELEPTDHPLAVEQRKGISRDRVEEIAHIVLGHGG